LGLNYVSMLEKASLVEKSKKGKEVKVKAKVVIFGIGGVLGFILRKRLCKNLQILRF